jgi:hypothetical protein
MRERARIAGGALDGAAAALVPATGPVVGGCAALPLFLLLGLLLSGRLVLGGDAG